MNEVVRLTVQLRKENPRLGLREARELALRRLSLSAADARCPSCGQTIPADVAAYLARPAHEDEKEKKTTGSGSVSSLSPAGLKDDGE